MQQSSLTIKMFYGYKKRHDTHRVRDSTGDGRGIYLRLGSLSSAERAFSSSRLYVRHCQLSSTYAPAQTHLGCLDTLQDLLAGLVRPARMKRLLLWVAVQARTELGRLKVARVVALLLNQDQSESPSHKIAMNDVQRGAGGC